MYIFRLLNLGSPEISCSFLWSQYSDLLITRIQEAISEIKNNIIVISESVRDIKALNNIQANIWKIDNGETKVIKNYLVIQKL